MKNQYCINYVRIKRRLLRLCKHTKAKEIRKLFEHFLNKGGKTHSYVDGQFKRNGCKIFFWIQRLGL